MEDSALVDERNVRDEADNASMARVASVYGHHRDAVRDTPETVAALKAWLATKKLYARNIDAENQGLDCFYVSILFAVTKDVYDTMADVVVPHATFVGKTVAELRCAVVEYANVVWNDPTQPEHDIIAVCSLLWLVIGHM